jgi:hypothetical protein
VGTASGINQLIYVLGLRNPYTFAVQPGTGTIFINDVGETTWEEINQSVAGANYGWSGGNTDGFGQTPPGPGVYHDPLLAYNHSGGPAGGGDAIVGGTFYNPATPQFPSSYIGKYFYEDLGGGWIRVFDPAHPGNAANPDTSTAFASGTPGGLRDLKVDSAGNLYYLAGNDGSIEKISFPASNQLSSIWSSTATPAVPAANDPYSVELGVKFRSDVAGYITGIRFYKGAGNTGTHVGYLWSGTGALLASATFTGETATGWQQVNFSTPVAITAGTTYIAAYLAPAGHYAYNSSYFASSGVDSGVLHALSNTAAGGNGVYRYGSGGFPSQAYLASNYWVDVVFSATASGSVTGARANIGAPSAGPLLGTTVFPGQGRRIRTESGRDRSDGRPATDGTRSIAPAPPPAPARSRGGPGPERKPASKPFIELVENE